ncbi:MAG: TonB-dependent receptor [Reyranellaceae bacterium]
MSARATALCIAISCGAVAAARGQTPPVPPATELPPMVVTAPTIPAARPPESASERSVSGAEMRARPAARPGELLEITPGLIVTQHSGEGKANQYYLRGFNLDHGTDLAITVDGMPANMRTHGHGQGYADLGFMIPEFVRTLSYRKGPYYADEGDFASAGAIHLDYVDRLDKNFVQLSGGSFGFWRAVAGASLALGGGYLTAGGEINLYDGPWDRPDRVRKFNGLLRYSQGTVENGFSLTAMAYSNRWFSTDQVAQRAIDSGQIGRFGTLDASDGGAANRYSLSARWTRRDDDGASRVEAFVVRSTLSLFNNFTYLLDDPVNGDQFNQTDRRTILGLNASHAFDGQLAGFATQTRIGLQTRYDDIGVGLFRTANRVRLSTVRSDSVKEWSIGLYAENTTRWTDWLRTIVGIRGDYLHGSVTSDTAANSGNVGAFIASPKAGVVLGPFARTELYLNAGFGHHSNDVRGATISVDPNDGVTPLSRVPLLVRSRGIEIGARTRIIPGLESALSLFLLDFDSEIVFVGDAGTTEASRPSRRIGIEWTNHYHPVPWIGLDLDVAYTRAQFRDADPAGDRIPGAPGLVLAAGIHIGGQTGWYGGARLRFFGARPLIEDNSVRSRPTALVSARVGYAFENGFRVQLEGFNLLNSKASQIDYFYTSRLAGEPAGGVDGIHLHPVEPMAFRLTASKTF